MIITIGDCNCNCNVDNDDYKCDCDGDNDDSIKATFEAQLFAVTQY